MPANRPSANMLLAHGDTPFGLDTWDIFDAPAHTDSAALDMESGVGFTGAGFVTDVGSGSALTPVLYLTEPGDNSAINVNDIHQGQIGDCFLLSAFGEMALYHPSAISNMIHFNPNGTETVFLYGGSNGSPPQFGQYSFTSMTETVTNTFSGSSVNNGATQDVVGSQKEIWPQVIEKAYALASGGYSGIQNGGSPFLALEELTGKAAIWMRGFTMSLTDLAQHSAAGDLIVMDTFATSNLPFNLVGNHAYMFEGMKSVGGTTYVQLGNPWGYDQPSLIPFAQLSRGIAEVDIGHL